MNATAVLDQLEGMGTEQNRKIYRRHGVVGPMFGVSYANLRIEREVHTGKNRVRYAINNALIAIGLRSPSLEEKSLAAVGRIGKIEVDHGETGCKTPDAATYIRKTNARRAERVQVDRQGAGG